MPRRSARLASASKVCESKVNNRTDVAAGSPNSATPLATPTPNLASVAEHAESPLGGSQSLNSVANSPVKISPDLPKTPSHATPVKPARSEMHPSKYQHCMAPPSSGLQLGFTDIKPQRRGDAPFQAAAQYTPTKAPSVRQLPTPTVASHSARAAASGLRLSTNAQRVVEDVRDEWAQIKDKVLVQWEAETRRENTVNSRKIAKAKGKADRFGDAHMSLFEKMGSIANHPSAFRAQIGCAAPLKAGLKRNQSKADLNGDEAARTCSALTPGPALERSPSKAKLHGAESVAPKQRLSIPSFAKTRPRAALGLATPLLANKRAKKSADDDVSTLRPISRDGSFLPRLKSAGHPSAVPHSKSSLASFAAPTRSFLAKTIGVKTPSHTSIISPTKPTPGGLPHSATMAYLPCASTELETANPGDESHVQSPGCKPGCVNSIRSSHKPPAAKPGSLLPKPSIHALLSAGKRTARVDSTTPPRNMPIKQVAFTPETRRATYSQQSPSPVKSGIPLWKSRQVLGEVNYPTLASVSSQEDERPVSYPVFSAKQCSRPQAPVCHFKATSPSSTENDESGPSDVKFRSERMVCFNGVSHSDLGSSPGQSSVRQFRPSMAPTARMPGSFCTMLEEERDVNKENESPGKPRGWVPHGIKNNKRSRVSSDEEDLAVVEAQRAAKKRKQDTVPEGEALLAPDLVGGTWSSQKSVIRPDKLRYRLGSCSPGSPSPLKKRSVISMNRLSMLARPRLRK